MLLGGGVSLTCISLPNAFPCQFRSGEVLRETLSKLEERNQLDPADPALDRLKAATLLAVSDLESKQSESDESGSDKAVA